MGTTEWVGINQPVLNGMAGTSEREVWSKGHAFKPFVIISCTKILWYESYGTFGQVSWCEQEQSQGGCRL